MFLREGLTNYLLVPALSHDLSQKNPIQKRAGRVSYVVRVPAPVQEKEERKMPMWLQCAAIFSI
jgi:hypothetical protein